MGPGESLSDAELIRRIIDGDENAFSVLHDRHVASLIAYSHKRTDDSDDAQTVVQETWLKVSQHIGELREPEKFPRWIFRIAYQLIVDLHREHRKDIKSYPSLAFLMRARHSRMQQLLSIGTLNNS